MVVRTQKYCMDILHVLVCSKDVLREDRAIGDAFRGDQSNFLHPVIYYYKEFPSSYRGTRSMARTTVYHAHHAYETVCYILSMAFLSMTNTCTYVSQEGAQQHCMCYGDSPTVL